MTLQERVAQWPERKRRYGFLATIIVAFAGDVVVFRLVEPEITSRLSFWLDLVRGVAVTFAFVYMITPRGQFWRRSP